VRGKAGSEVEKSCADGGGFRLRVQRLPRPDSVMGRGASEMGGLDAASLR